MNRGLHAVQPDVAPGGGDAGLMLGLMADRKISDRNDLQCLSFPGKRRNRSEAKAATPMTDTPIDVQPGLAADEPEHCHEC
jgi:hypothetical protein